VSTPSHPSTAAAQPGHLYPGPGTSQLVGSGHSSSKSPRTGRARSASPGCAAQRVVRCEAGIIGEPPHRAEQFGPSWCPRVRPPGVGSMSPSDERYRRVTSAASSHTALSRFRVSVIRTYTSRPVQPRATVSTCSSPSSTHTTRAVISIGWWNVCSGWRAPVSLRIF
jgi:hypothetical protein